MEEHNEYEEIDLSQLYHLIKSNLKYIILTALTGAVVALAFTIFFIDQEYASVASLYLKPKVVEGVVDSNGLTTNQKLVSDYMIIMKSDKVLTPVA
ncbi:MAG: Wzz/FepE/Etk N-terminal domain-containing protein, partial [Erysipelotrichaceae bacterium]